MNDGIQKALAVGEDEAARRLGLSTSTLRSWRSQQRGPSYCRAGRRILYTLRDLEAFLESNRVETVTQ